MQRLAIIVPVLNEAAVLPAALERLAPLRARGARVIVVDGGSDDGSDSIARAQADVVLSAARGRASQMNDGAAAALADAGVGVLLFLHADAVLPADADRHVANAVENRREAWGRFDVEIVGRSRWLRVVAALMNTRSRLTGICTGDQAIFATRSLYERLGGYAPIALMEDIDFSRRARRVARPLAVSARVQVSGRRWERHGVLRTIVLMWRLRLAYRLGADPARLAAAYRDAR
jgi:rSAM/selenodomain-associated transferase 2